MRLLIAAPFLWGIELAAHLPQSYREALQERHWPGLLANVVRQVGTALLAACEVIELRHEVSRLMDQAAARGRPAENEAPRKEYHVIECVLCVVLEVKILVVGNLAFHLILDGHATVVMRNRSSVPCDVEKNRIFFSCWIDDGQPVLILNLAPLVCVRTSPLPLALRRHRLGFGRRGLPWFPNSARPCPTSEQ
jgi:hypothetical protein